MLATGMYLTDESMMNGSGFKASNALNAFLQSEIQNIAGSALKTVDLSMVKAFELAGYTEEELKAKFGALYNAFQFGAPPHAGMARTN